MDTNSLVWNLDRQNEYLCELKFKRGLLAVEVYKSDICILGHSVCVCANKIKDTNIYANFRTM